jgi:hypothetical protein
MVKRRKIEKDSNTVSTAIASALPALSLKNHTLQVYNDLESVDFLQNTSSSKIITGYIAIVHRWAMATLRGKPYYPTFRVMKLKMFVYSVVY